MQTAKTARYVFACSVASGSSLLLLPPSERATDAMASFCEAVPVSGRLPDSAAAAMVRG